MDIFDNSLKNSQEKDGDGSDGCLTDTKDIISAQGLTIVEEDGSLGSGEEQPGVADIANSQSLLEAGDDEVQYQFRSAEGGTVTYRVVQVGSDTGDPLPQIVSGSNFSTTQSGGVQVLSSPLNGQFYVIGSPQEVFGNQNSRSLAPRAGLQLESGRLAPTRDDRRRATHNEVERRRRDKINNWIGKLSKIIPDCTAETAKSGQQSKGGILAKACEYIGELRSSNQLLSDANKEVQVLVDMLKQENEKLRRENTLLRAQLSGNVDSAS